MSLKPLSACVSVRIVYPELILILCLKQSSNHQSLDKSDNVFVYCLAEIDHLDLISSGIEKSLHGLDQALKDNHHMDHQK